MEYPIQLQIGDKVFVHTKFDYKKLSTYISFCMRLFGKIRYNHLRLVCKDGDKLVFVEAKSNGVVISDIKYDPNSELILIKRNHTILNPSNYNLRVLKLVWKPYDYVGIFVELMWNMFNIWIGPKSECDALKRFFCYEVGFYADEDQIKLACGVKWWEIKPLVYFNLPFMETIYADSN